MNWKECSQVEGFITGFHVHVGLSLTLYIMALSKLKEKTEDARFVRTPAYAIAILQPTTAFTLRLSKKPPKSSFLTSTTQCSKLSILTLAFVS